MEEEEAQQQLLLSYLLAGLGHGFQNYTHLKIFSHVHNGQEEEEEAKVRRGKRKEKKGEERREK